ncbi:MAG: GNAT family N-acetyltransferase [Polaromonas sp.]|uniref:GNAT family N-acetyltransferase n=1 Tax=Polaromonas sp. TaxID=1869339 RepID=UPI00272F9C9D|nr:GNAT family N-acetyltransferase [Polaromonas sp.]MDP1742194.1 GNAT family N-acetyltransferase [Polaromonas sp.]MDP3354412.1 GNAT family N-acetyltransferase [Polaromonas sp.]
MTVAVLTASDAAPYKALMLHAYENAADAFTSTPEERAKESDEWWVKRIAHPEGMTVAFGEFKGESLVGTVALEFSAKPKTKHKALVVGMYVLPLLRGNGSARALLQAAIQFCTDRGDIRAVQLEVTEGNTPAISLYESLGFTAYGLEPMAVLTPTGFRSKVHMWRSLPSPANAASPLRCGCVE